VRKAKSRSFKLSAELDNLLCTKAKRLGITASEAIRYALISWLCNTQGNTHALPNQIHHQTAYTHTDDVQAHAKPNCDPQPLDPTIQEEREETPKIDIPKGLEHMRDLLDNPWAGLLMKRGRRKD